MRLHSSAGTGSSADIKCGVTARAKGQAFHRLTLHVQLVRQDDLRRRIGDEKNHQETLVKSDRRLHSGRGNSIPRRPELSRLCLLFELSVHASATAAASRITRDLQGRSNG